MAEILLVNPRSRKRRKTRSHRKTRSRHRRARVAVAVANPRRRRHRVRMSNPRHRRHRRHYARMLNPRRRRHRNPSFRGMGTAVVPTLKAGLVGATGALGLDLLWGYGQKWLPTSIAGSPLAQYAVKLAGALVVGVVGNKLMRGKGRDLAVGATTVVLHDALKAQIQSSFPSINLGQYLTYAPSVGVMNRAGRVLSTGMGEYMNGLDHMTDNTQMGMNNDGAYSADGMSGY